MYFLTLGAIIFLVKVTVVEMEESFYRLYTHCKWFRLTHGLYITACIHDTSFEFIFIITILIAFLTLNTR